MGFAHNGWSNGLEIRVQGRGGQGAVTLAALIADAAFRSGWQALAFPTFGTERTGAPVAAYVRLSPKPIFDRSEVDGADVVIVQDATLVGSVDLSGDGLILLNAEAIPADIAGAPVAAIGATRLALEHLGTPKTSTAMLGFFAAITGLVTLDAVEAAIADRFRGEVARRNIALARAAYGVAIEVAA